MAWAIEQQEVKEPSSRFLLLCLCHYSDATGDSIFPSVARLSRDTGLSERAVQYQLRKLIKAGVLVRSNPAIAAAKVRRADRAPTCYRVVMTGCNPLHPVTLRGATHFATGCNLEQNGVQPIAPDPSEIRQLTKRESARAIPTGSCAEPNPEASAERRAAFKQQLRALARVPLSKRGGH